jgi:hypothetical protein
MSIVNSDSNSKKGNAETALVTKPSNSNVAIVSASNSIITPPKPRIKPKILGTLHPLIPSLTLPDEDTYIDSLEQIIQRDFFPDLPKLRTQLDWLEAEEGGNLEKMREIYGKLKTGSLVTPKGRSLVTPSGWSPINSTPHPDAEPIDPSYLSDQQQLNTDMSLSKFQLLHTSEDNQSFDTLLEKQNLNQKTKYAWLTENGKVREIF